MKFYSLEEIANQLHMTAGTARNRISRGDPMPPHLKIGRRLLFPEIEMKRWLEKISESMGL